MQLVEIEWKHERRGFMKHDQHLHSQWYILFFAYNELIKRDGWTNPVKKMTWISIWWKLTLIVQWLSTDWKKIINSCVRVWKFFLFFFFDSVWGSSFFGQKLYHSCKHMLGN